MISTIRPALAPGASRATVAPARYGRATSVTQGANGMAAPIRRVAVAGTPPA